MAMLIASDTVEPFGEERDDIRGAIHSANVIASNCWGEVPDHEFKALVKHLMCYLKSYEGDEIPDTVVKEVLKSLKPQGE